MCFVMRKNLSSVEALLKGCEKEEIFISNNPKKEMEMLKLPFDGESNTN